MSTITNDDDTIDSRQVIERIQEIREEIEDIEADEDRDEDELTDLREELAPLEALADEGEGASGDWFYGATLINESYFVEYAKEFAEDIGAVSDPASWPATHIDWDEAADELLGDYTSVDFDGITFYVR